MINNEIKLPAVYAQIDENEMEYLTGGAVSDSQAYQIFSNLGYLFNQVARVFSAASSIVNNVKAIVSAVEALNKFTLTGKN